jgi:hypothetical protein
MWRQHSILTGPLNSAIYSFVRIAGLKAIWLFPLYSFTLCNQPEIKLFSSFHIIQMPAVQQDESWRTRFCKYTGRSSSRAQEFLCLGNVVRNVWDVVTHSPHSSSHSHWLASPVSESTQDHASTSACGAKLQKLSLSYWAHPLPFFWASFQTSVLHMGYFALSAMVADGA